MTRITAALLRRLGANCEGVEDFKEVFPKGAEITLENCLLAAGHHLNIDWFARRYLKPQALEAYKQVKTPALEAYYKVVASASEAYSKAIVQVDYQQATAWADYKKTQATALEDYYKATAQALYEVVGKE